MAIQLGCAESPVPPRVRRGFLLGVLGFCFLYFAVFHWVFWPVRVSGESMAPTYEDGQASYINKFAYLTESPQRGDVVAIQIGKGECQLKRIIGLPGEKVEFRRGVVVVNGRPLREPYVVHDLLWWLPTFQLGPEEYFVMGDNRRISMLGPVLERNIIGRALF